MSWVRKTLLVSAGLFLAGCSLGFGFSQFDEVSFAGVMTTAGGVLIAGSIVAVLFAALILVAEWVPRRGFRADPSPWVLLWIAYGFWLLVPGIVLLAGSYEDIKENDPCGLNLVGGWAAGHSSQGSHLTDEDLGWPPLSHRCVIDGPEGKFETVLPTTATWLATLALLALPIGAWPIARQLAAAERNRVATPG